MSLIEIATLAGTFLLAFVIFGFTVFIHELGHFLAARRMGLHVDEFAIGFGPKMVSKKWRGVTYSINWVPFGGYVKLPQMAPMEMAEGKNETPAETLPPVGPWQKIVTAFAGPLFSLLLGVVLAVAVFYTGYPKRVELKTTTLGYIVPDGPAAQAGLREGDTILRINGQVVRGWAGHPFAIQESVFYSEGASIVIDVLRPGDGERTFTVFPKKNPNLENLRTIGIGPAQTEVSVTKIMAGSPAEKAGLQSGDVIVAVNGVKLWSDSQAVELISGAGTTPVVLDLLRAGAAVTTTVTPQVPFLMDAEGRRQDFERPMIGVDFSKTFEAVRVIDHPKPWDQVINSGLLIFRTMKALVSPASDVGFQHMSGPVGIFKVIKDSLLIDWRMVLHFGVVLNINLAVMNMLPLPVLDGGHIVLGLIEAIRRRVVEFKLLYYVQSAFFFLLMGFLLFTVFKDGMRWHKDSEFTKDRKQDRITAESLRFD
jgi:regulator of sigma E protease